MVGLRFQSLCRLNSRDVVLEFPENPNDRWLIPQTVCVGESQEESSALELTFGVLPLRPRDAVPTTADRTQAVTPPDKVHQPPQTQVTLQILDVPIHVKNSLRSRYKSNHQPTEVCSVILPRGYSRSLHHIFR